MVKDIGGLKLLGLENGRVKLSCYSSEWEELFCLEEKQLRNRLGDIAVGIQHVGSTSIPGMISKPIIDILITVKDKQFFIPALKPLYDLGYRFLGNAGRRGRLFFVKGQKDITNFHLHLVEENSHYSCNYLFFRDYLRKYVDIAREYESLKKRLSKEYPYDRDKYSRSKSRFVKRILRKNKNLVYCKENNFYDIYKEKSLFTQRYMDLLVLQRGIGDLIREINYRAAALYNCDNNFPFNFHDVKEHLKGRFNKKELEIIFEEKEKSLEERLRIKEAVILIEMGFGRIRERKRKLRRLEFLLLRGMGYTYQEIARELNVSASNASRIVKDENVKVEKVAQELKKICNTIIRSLI